MNTPHFNDSLAPSTPKLPPKLDDYNPHTSTPITNPTQDLLVTALLLNSTEHQVDDFVVLPGEENPSAEGVPKSVGEAW